jgi:hypothetical protein
MFAQLFAVAIAITAVTITATALLAIRETRQRRAQRRHGYIFTPAQALIDAEDAPGARSVHLFHVEPFG